MLYLKSFCVEHVDHHGKSVIVSLLVIDPGSMLFVHSVFFVTFVPHVSIYSQFIRLLESPRSEGTLFSKFFRVPLEKSEPQILSFRCFVYNFAKDVLISNFVYMYRNYICCSSYSIKKI